MAAWQVKSIDIPLIKDDALPILSDQPATSGGEVTGPLARCFDSWNSDPALRRDGTIDELVAGGFRSGHLAIARRASNLTPIGGCEMVLANAEESLQVVAEVDPSVASISNSGAGWTLVQSMPDFDIDLALDEPNVYLGDDGRLMLDN